MFSQHMRFGIPTQPVGMDARQVHRHTNLATHPCNTNVILFSPRPSERVGPRAENHTNYTRQAQVGGVCERENYTRNYAGNYAKNYTSIARGPWVLCGLWLRPP